MIITYEEQIFQRDFPVVVVLLRTPKLWVMALTSFDQVCQQVSPLCPELVGTRQTAVASYDTQVGDAQLN